MDARPELMTFAQLKKMGFPYSKTQLVRLMNDPSYVERRFPPCRKLGSSRGKMIWRTKDVLAYLQKHGLFLDND